MENMNNTTAANQVRTTNVFAMMAKQDNNVQPIWAGLEGFHNFSSPVTMQECMEQIGADYKVTKERLIRIPNDVYEAILHGDDCSSLLLSMNEVIDSHVATVNSRDNQTLGVVGKDYGIVQNHEAFRFIDFLTHGDCGVKPTIETAGVLDGGRRVFVTAKMPNQFKIAGDSGIDDYVVFHTTHDGTSSVSVVITPIRVICANTLNAALRSSNKLTFRHTKNVDLRIENEQRALSVLKMHERYASDFVESLEFMRQAPVNNKDMWEFACRMFVNDSKVMKAIRDRNYNIELVEDLSTRAKNQIYALVKATESGIGQNEHRGSRLWLWNGLTTYFSNYCNFGGAGDSLAVKAEKKFDSVFDGSSAKKTQEAYEYLMAV